MSQEMIAEHERAEHARPEAVDEQPEAHQAADPGDEEQQERRSRSARSGRA